LGAGGEWMARVLRDEVGELENRLPLLARAEQRQRLRVGRIGGRQARPRRLTRRCSLTGRWLGSVRLARGELGGDLAQGFLDFSERLAETRDRLRGIAQPDAELAQGLRGLATLLLVSLAEKGDIGPERIDLGAELVQVALPGASGCEHGEEGDR